MSVLLAIGLGLIGLWLIVMEITFISGGLLGLAAATCLGFSLGYAFASALWFGWLWSALLPLGGVLVLRWGLKRLGNSAAVPQSEITAHTNYGSDPADGDIGTLLTAARPGGRARFAAADCDVLVHGGGEVGQRVRVLRREGPSLLVQLADPSPAAQHVRVESTDSTTNASQHPT